MGFSEGEGGGVAEGRAAAGCAEAVVAPFAALAEGAAGVSLATGSGGGGLVSELQAAAPRQTKIQPNQQSEMAGCQAGQGRAAGEEAWYMRILTLVS
jgi:hypothetical protein